MYLIKLPNFEGPFDLLLYFIKRDELNIYDIPIARITEEFLNYIRLIKFFDLELAGEFLLTASTLVYIKSQMLLPKEENPETAETEDPRLQLVRRLIEYKQFKEAGKDLSEFFEAGKYTYYRNLFDYDNQMLDSNSEIVYKNANIFELLRVFQSVLDKSKQIEPTHLINIYPISVDEKITLILEKLQLKKRLKFSEINENLDRRHIIATFLAILDLLNKMKIIVRQNDLFDEIIILLRPENISN